MAAVEDKEESNAMFTSRRGLMHRLMQLSKGTRYPELAIWTGIRS